MYLIGTWPFFRYSAGTGIFACPSTNRRRTYGQESPGWISLFKLVTFLLLKISRHLNFFGKIGWSMNSGPQRAGDSQGFLKKYFHFQNSTKMVTKLRQLKKVEFFQDPSLHFSFLNCLNSATIFCRVLKITIIFSNIPSYPPPFAVRNSLTNQFYQNN